MRQKYARATAVVMQERKFLLVQERKRQRFSLPGGRIRQGESSLEAVTRELHEETGLKVLKDTFIGTHEGRYASHHVYLLETRGEVKLNRRELSNSVWWDGTDTLLVDSHVTAIVKMCRDYRQSVRILMASDENEELEFKSSLRFDRNKSRIDKCLEKAVIKTLAGFLNQRGGTLLIGVADDGTVVGISEDYRTFKTKPNRGGFELHLHNIIRDKLGEAVSSYLRTTFHEVDDQDICRVDVSPSDFPVYLEEENTFYLRTGSSTRKLPTSEVIKHALSCFKGARRASSTLP